MKAPSRIDKGQEVPPYKHSNKEKDIEFVFIEINLKIKRAYGYANRTNIWVTDEKGNKKYLFSSISGGDEMTIEQIIDIMPEEERDRGSYKPILYKMKEGTEKKWSGIVRNL